MIRSMTGYGDAERAIPAGRLVVEVRTVNHRHLHTSFRTPSALARYEGEMREWLRESLSRGHATCTVRVVPEGDGALAGAVRVDDERVAAYLAAFRHISERFGVLGTPDLTLLARFNDILVRDRSEEPESEVPLEELRATVEGAVRANVRMREDEGRRLRADLEGRLAAIGEALAAIRERAPARLVAERDRLRAAVRELASGVGVDEERLAQEIAYLAERWDVSEELVRFDSHIELFRELLAAEAAEPVGKRLSFLVQEMHREANTIGSKANDALIAHCVVAVKDEIERLREQVENVE
ncbi:MAG TPA: YicC/YloC family endoribonuclease [Longimicrobiaceae bacterium]|nr:YicC/YloC family endoribonuclease [Longimicrobiaceae bacterium]